MTEQPPTYWFPAKRYGWGWGMPRTWQGWGVLVAYVAVLGAVTVTVGNRGVSAVVVLVATAVLLVVCLKKGEPTRWRWGRD